MQLSKFSYKNNKHLLDPNNFFIKNNMHDILTGKLIFRDNKRRGNVSTKIGVSSKDIKDHLIRTHNTDINLVINNRGFNQIELTRPHYKKGIMRSIRKYGEEATRKIWGNEDVDFVLTYHRNK